MRPLMEYVDVCIGNEEDAALCLGFHPEADVEGGKTDWVKVLKEFYPDFEKDLENAQKAVEKVKIKDEESDVVCDKCGRKMVYKISKFGKFLACPG